MSIRKQLSRALAASVGVFAASGFETAIAAEPPRLILALTIDGLCAATSRSGSPTVSAQAGSVT